jgi:hypothetical protein
VVAGRLDCSVVGFCDFRYGESAALGAVAEKCCEQEGLRFEMDLMALEPGLMGTILVAMIVDGVYIRSSS